MEVATATRERVAAALAKLRDLLGPGGAPVEVETADTGAPGADR
jgi:hypothetical protein